MAHLGLLQSVDGLYADVVMRPDAWTEQSFADWAGDLASEPLGKTEARAIRQVVRVANKLQQFWLGHAQASEDTPWHSRVDLAVGPKAWRPTLDIAMAGLLARPDPELYEEVQMRFRLVNSQGWMDGVAYEDWLAEHEASSTEHL